MKKKKQPPQEELEQFEAYGEYSYAYKHAADQKHRHDANQPGFDELQENEFYPDWQQNEDINEDAYREVVSPEERAKARSRAITGRLIFLLAVVVVGLIVLQSVVFRLKTVYVVGNVNKTAQQVAGASGLVKGLNIFAISAQEVQRNLSNDHTIVFLGLQKEYPSTIYLYISEREAVSSMQWLGLRYTLDKEGVVMSESSSMERPQNLPSVIGLQITNIHVGQKLEVRGTEQLQAYMDIIEELQMQYYSDQIVEMNLSDTKNLYLLTASGISVRLGDRSIMRAKIGALRTDIAYLLQLGKASGTLDVSIPENAKYRPDS